MKRIIVIAALLWAGQAIAADNAVILDPGTTVVMRSKDVGSGVQSPYNILGDTSGVAIYGTAGSSNTNVLSVQGIASGTALPISAASLPLPTLAATSTKQSDGTQKTQIVDGSGNVIASTSNALSVNVANANSNGQATMANSSPIAIASNQSSIPVAATLGAETTKNIGTVSQLPYPSGAIPYTATATGTTGATTATLAGASSVTTYLCGFSIRANATAAATGNATVTGVITATLNFTQWTAPNASGLGITEMIFAPCIPASGTNQSVAVVSAAPGTGGVVSVTAWGYKL